MADLILIAEDDRNTAALVAAYLTREGFETLVAHDGEEALEQARRRPPALVVLDLMLPKRDGAEVARTLRTFSDVPILILTARGEEVDRIVGFALGADDYVVKPFSPRELVERVKAILRRTRRGGAVPGALLAREDLVLDREKARVTVAGRPVALTPSEYRILETLMAAPGRLFSREQLLEQLHEGGEVVVERVIDVHVGNLRQKIEPEPARPRYILTARGLGYRFADADEP